MRSESMTRREWYTPNPEAGQGLYVPKLTDARHIDFHLTLQYSTETLQDYIVQEKLDGNLFLFTGKHVYTKTKKMYELSSFPEWWQRLALPSVPLMGELYAGCYKQHKLNWLYNHASGSDNVLWLKTKYIVYDIPGLEARYEERLKLLQKMVHNWNKSICMYHKIDYATHHLQLPLQAIAAYDAIQWRQLFYEVLEQPTHRELPAWGDSSHETRTPGVLHTANLACGEGLVFYHRGATWHKPNKLHYIKLKPVIAIPGTVQEKPTPNQVWLQQVHQASLSSAVDGVEYNHLSSTAKQKEIRRSALPGWTVNVRCFDPVNGMYIIVNAFVPNQSIEEITSDFADGQPAMVQFTGRDWSRGSLTAPVASSALNKKKRKMLLDCIRSNASQFQDETALQCMLDTSSSESVVSNDTKGTRFIHSDNAVLHHMLKLHTVLPIFPIITFPFANLLFWAGFSHNSNTARATLHSVPDALMITVAWPSSGQMVLNDDNNGEQNDEEKRMQNISNVRWQIGRIWSSHLQSVDELHKNFTLLILYTYGYQMKHKKIQLESIDTDAIRNTLLHWVGLQACQIVLAKQNGNRKKEVSIPVSIVLNIVAHTWCIACGGHRLPDSREGHNMLLQNIQHTIKHAIAPWLLCVSRDLLLTVTNEIIKNHMQTLRRPHHTPKHYNRADWLALYDVRHPNKALAAFEAGYRAKVNEQLCTNIHLHDDVSEALQNLDIDLDVYWQPVRTQQSEDYCKKRARKDVLAPTVPDCMLSKASSLQRLFR